MAGAIDQYSCCLNFLVRSGGENQITVFPCEVDLVTHSRELIEDRS